MKRFQNLNTLLKYFYVAVFLISLQILTVNYQFSFIDIYLMKIPISCLDENNDGMYDKRDFNYSGINFFDKKSSNFVLMDKKGSFSKDVECDFKLKENNYEKYLSTVDCIGYCRLNGYLNEAVK